MAIKARFRRPQRQPKSRQPNSQQPRRSPMHPVFSSIGQSVAASRSTSNMFGQNHCLICSRTPSDAHHLRFAQPRALGRKVSDEFTVPLCRVHHRQLHNAGKEIDWWSAVDRDVDPLRIAKDLWDGNPKPGSKPPREIVSRRPHTTSEVNSHGNTSANRREQEECIA